MLALVTGRGSLPRAIAQAQDSLPLVCTLEGYEPDGLQADISFRVEHLGSLIEELKQRGIKEICFCGAIERPQFDPGRLDALTLPLVPIMMEALQAGDDGALRAILKIFEQSGFEIRSAHELAPSLLAPKGVLSEAQPDEQIERDVDRANEVLASLAKLDIGQGCVVGAGQVWGIETLGGTDHMLATLPEGVKKARAVLVKRPKTGQDLRVDLPTIGPASIEAAANAGLAGLVIQAGLVLIIDRDATLKAADDAGLVLWARRDM